MDDSQHQQQQQQHHHEKIKLVEINSYLTCYLCKGYLIDATTISECLHSFCRSCIIKFLQENCYCPVCEVIINKAKPCLKLDKTLQDIVYKLVPELFTKEMHRRKQFYQFRPALARKVSPEERGEDTERTIFNPQDAISLSIEYVSDDSTPGAIPSLPVAPASPIPHLAKVINNNSINKNNKTSASSTTPSGNSNKSSSKSSSHTEERSNNLNLNHQHNNNSNFNKFNNNNNNNNNSGSANSESNNNNYISDNPMKRYLQCPGMCRIEVLKKFVRNKYNVDTSLFHIDILYKRVPLPDHYTLIDIGYIYSWKRNEPMKFFFRITDINKVSERFDYFDARSISADQQQQQIQSTPLKQHNFQNQSSAKQVTTTGASNAKKTSHHHHHNHQKRNNQINETVANSKKVFVKNVDVKVTNKTSSLNNLVKNNNNNNHSAKKRGIVSDESDENFRKNSNVSAGKQSDDTVKKITNESGGSCGDKSSASSVYTNITLKRSDNLEIVTKIQKVANNNNNNKNCQLINLPNNHSDEENRRKVLKTSEKTDSAPCSDTPPKENNVSKTIESVVTSSEEDFDSKSKFLKSIELTAKSSISPATTPQKQQRIVVPIVVPPSSSSGVLVAPKRKTSSPSKAPPVEKKPRLSHQKSTPMRIVIQPKSMQNAAVRQIVTNLNQNVNNMTKIVEQTTSNAIGASSPPPSSGNVATSAPSVPGERKQSDLQSLIDNCKINIPSSLSITLNESNGDGGTRIPHPSIPPVKNFIEILKLAPENNNAGCENKPSLSPPLSGNGTANKLQSFQKIFEESLAKKKGGKGVENDKQQQQQQSNSKRSILEIALQLQQKTKIEAENKSKMSDTSESGKAQVMESTGKSGIVQGRVSSSSPQSSKSPPKNNASLHSPSLGLNYTVSVENDTKKTLPPAINNNNLIKKSNTGTLSSLHQQEKKISPQQEQKKGITASSFTPALSHNRLIKPKVKSVGGGGVILKKNSSDLSSSQLLEKYNIQNLAQLTASFQGTLSSAGNGNGGVGGGTAGSSPSLSNGGAASGAPSNSGFSSALQHAMFMKHIEHQNWLNLNQGSLMQYEKYLQNLNAAQSKIMGNAIIKEN